MPSAGRLLVIACGALAREISALKRANRWAALDVTCLAPELHNTPDRIVPALAAEVRAARGRYDDIFVAYADCGTGGQLDRFLEAEKISRLPGAHCYEFYATTAVFEQLAEAEPGTFYLTDFLVRHFDRLVAGSLGLDRHPELVQEYFRHYRRVVYLVQTPDETLTAAARSIADRLGLQFEVRATGYGDLENALGAALQRAGISVVTESARG